MSGVAAIRYKLANDATLTAQVSADKIVAGTLPLGTQLPAISVMSIDGVPRTTVAMPGTARFITERVQVTVLATGYPEKMAILELVRKALPLSKGEYNGVKVDSIIPDTLGPDFDDVADGVYERSRDFMVRWQEQ